MKTPEQIAKETSKSYRLQGLDGRGYARYSQALVAAIEADRAQRDTPSTMKTVYAGDLGVGEIIRIDGELHTVTALAYEAGNAGIYVQIMCEDGKPRVRHHTEMIETTEMRFR